jgi:hypothetical protein
MLFFLNMHRVAALFRFLKPLKRVWKAGKQVVRLKAYYFLIFNPLKPELNPFAQRNLPRYFNGNFNF